MFEKILVPVDGSGIAEKALSYAERLAHRLGSTIILISVYPPEGEPEKEQYRLLHSHYSQKITSSARSNVIKVQSAILPGEPAAAILDYAEKKKVGLIVMGTRGRSAIKRWMLGSIADKIEKAGTVPLALVTTEKTEIAIPEKSILRKALVILDGKEEDKTVVGCAAELASGLKIDVTLLQMVERALMYFEGADEKSYVPVSDKEMASRRAKARKYLESVGEPLREKGVKVNVRTTARGNPAQSIIRVAGRIDADLIIMPTHGRSGISRWFFGNVRDDIVNYGDILVLLIRISG
jgi:nucleotide-binding universal stress UspA family protein